MSDSEQIDNGQKQPNAKAQGLVMVYTGDGKGKTTAALGMALRAVGYRWPVCMIQFIKGSWKYGELNSVARLAPELEFHVAGSGFVGIVDDKLPLEEHRKAARAAFELALEKIRSGAYRLVILDEFNVALQLELLGLKDLRELLAARPPELHLTLTGRGAPPELLEQADLVTEMKEIKHPYQRGILAQKGIDF